MVIYKIKVTSKSVMFTDAIGLNQTVPLRKTKY